MLNANCMLYLLVSYSRILIVIYNVVIKNENYLFLRFYLPLLDCDDCRSFELDLIIFQFITPLVSGWFVNSAYLFKSWSTKMA